MGAEAIEAGRLPMKEFARKFCFPLVLLLVLSLTTFVNAGPRRRPGHHSGGGTQTVAEPASLALLGMGLVSLGLYAKKNKNKK